MISLTCAAEQAALVLSAPLHVCIYVLFHFPPLPQCAFAVDAEESHCVCHCKPADFDKAFKESSLTSDLH